MTRPEPIWRWAAGDAARPVLTAGGSPCVSAGELASGVARAVTLLTGLGAGAGDRVLLVGTGPRATLELAMAGLTLGATVVPVPPSLVAGDAFLLAAADERTRCVVAGDAVPAAGRPWLREDAHDDVAPVARIADSAPGGAVADVRARGGGQPPAASSRSAAALNAQFTEALGLEPGAVTVVLLPHLNPFALALLAGLLHAGHHVVLPGGDVATIRAILTAGPSEVLATGPALAQLAGAGVLDLATVAVSIGAVPAGTREATRTSVVEYVTTNGCHDVVATDGAELTGFWSWSRARPGDVAVVAEDGSVVTAGDLARRVEVLAGVLHRAGPVAAVLDGTVDVMHVCLAAALAGEDVIVLPRGEQDVRHLLTTSGARLVVASATLIDDTRSTAAGLPDPPTVLPVSATGDPLPAGTRPAGRVVPHTSGTTGPPKVVLRPASGASPRAAAAWARVTGRSLGVHGRGRHLVTMPLTQGAPLYFALLALHAGQTLVAMDSWSPARALALAAEHDVTTSFMVPSMFASLLSLPPEARTRPPGIESVVHAAAACPVPVKQAMVEWWGPVLYDCYSPSELTGTYLAPGEWAERPGSVGRPFPGADVLVADAEGRPLPPGETGLVYLRDQGFAYAGGAVPASPLAGFATVGDLGYVDDDGWLFLVGRVTDYVSVGGAKFHPSEVEPLIASVPGVADCAVAGLPHRVLGQVAIAYVVPSPGQDHAALRGEVLRHARARLPAARVPARVRMVESLPRDAYGKLRRRELPQDL